MKQYELSESQIQRQCLDLLAAKRVFHWRANAGAMSGDHKGKKWFVRFGRSGQPDIFAVRKGLLIGIEVKRANGEQSLKQKEFETELVRAGGKYWLVRSLEDLERNLREAA